MEHSLISALALTVFLLSSPAFVESMFMDMFGQIFQAELLDDCSVYVYDRVLFIDNAPEDWCKRQKSSLNAMVVEFVNGDGNRFVSVLAFYVDNDNIVKLSILVTNGFAENVNMINQKHFEGNTATGYGRYMSEGIDAYHKIYETTYEACKYGKTKSRGLSYTLTYYAREYKVDAKRKPDCDPNMMAHYPVYITGTEKVMVQVYVHPDRTYERICKVGSVIFTLRPIKQSIQTCALAYNMVKNFHLSFPIPYSKQMNDFYPQFIGAEKDTKSIKFDGKFYQRPKIENAYTEQPFFFYNATERKYSPLFLNYKYKGSDRRFTVRFVYNNMFYDIFAPMEYMKQCKFTTQDTVAAAPRVIKQDEMSISIEVYFLINNVQFQFCVFDIKFKYQGAQYEVNLKLTSEINAYVHVQHRSTTAANCDYDGRTVRWLLAYSKNGDAELVSLDNSVSSPVFPCHHCGPDSKMYCDITPDAKRFHSAMLIQTVRNGKTDVTYVRVNKGRGYELRVDYHTASLKGEYYFLQNMHLKLELHEIFIRLEEGKPKDNLNAPIHKPDKSKVTSKPVTDNIPPIIDFTTTFEPIIHHENNDDQQDATLLTTTDDAFDENDEEYKPDWLDSGHSYYLYSWFILFVVFFVA